jgi:Tat protein secretion system quality control protein TatD with DNase activity
LSTISYYFFPSLLTYNLYFLAGFLYGTVGIHPTKSTEWVSSSARDHTLHQMTTLLQHPAIVAIGELGLGKLSISH